MKDGLVSSKSHPWVHEMKLMAAQLREEAIHAMRVELTRLRAARRFFLADIEGCCMVEHRSSASLAKFDPGKSA